MFCTPVSGSRVIVLVEVRVGAASKPGVETGIGRASSPLPSPSRSSPVSTTSWQGASSTITGGMGLAMAACHFGPISSTGTSIPSL